MVSTYHTDLDCSLHEAHLCGLQIATGISFEAGPSPSPGLCLGSKNSAGQANTEKADFLQNSTEGTETVVGEMILRETSALSRFKRGRKNSQMSGKSLLGAQRSSCWIVALYQSWESQEKFAMGQRFCEMQNGVLYSPLLLP